MCREDTNPLGIDTAGFPERAVMARPTADGRRVALLLDDPGANSNNVRWTRIGFLDEAGALVTIDRPEVLGKHRWIHEIDPRPDGAAVFVRSYEVVSEVSLPSGDVRPVTGEGWTSPGSLCGLGCVGDDHLFLLGERGLLELRRAGAAWREVSFTKVAGDCIGFGLLDGGDGAVVVTKKSPQVTVLRRSGSKFAVEGRIRWPVSRIMVRRDRVFVWQELFFRFAHFQHHSAGRYEIGGLAPSTPAISPGDGRSSGR